MAKEKNNVAFIIIIKIYIYLLDLYWMLSKGWKN